MIDTDGSQIRSGGSVQTRVSCNDDQPTVSNDVDQGQEETYEEENRAERYYLQLQMRQDCHRPIKATPLASYSHHIYDRRNELSTSLRSQQLFQQLIMDTYSKIDGEKLCCLR